MSQEFTSESSLQMLLATPRDWRPMVFLWHHQADQSHVDWFIETAIDRDPFQTNDRSLAGFRISSRPYQWLACQRIQLQMTPPHRRAYLTFQGETQSGVGRVQRLACGECRIELAGESRLVIELQTMNRQYRLCANRVSANEWIGKIHASEQGPVTD